MLTKPISKKRKTYITVMRWLMWLSTGITCGLVLFMIVYVLYKGIPNITWKMLSTSPSYLSDSIGILPDILNTVYILLASLVIVLPLGVGAAVYLTEYAASLTLVIMNLPTVMRTTQESLKTVPQSYREGAFGLGAGKWRVVRTVVLPGCVDGVITGCILSAGRILGESAALLFTAGFAHALNDLIHGLSGAGATLTVALYVYAKEQGEFGVAFAIAAILMIHTMLINFAAVLGGKYFKKRKDM